MAVSLAEVAGLLCCPDDGRRLIEASGDLRCLACDRRFPVHAQNVIEILPRHRQELPSSISSEYREGYKRAFDQKYKNSEWSMAWGAEESMTRSWILKRLRQVEFVRPLVTEGAKPGDSTLCDIAAGAGYYTLAYA